MKYFFSFSGRVEIDADTKEEAEVELLKMDQFELADCFSEFEVTDENGDGV